LRIIAAHAADYATPGYENLNLQKCVIAKR